MCGIFGWTGAPDAAPDEAAAVEAAASMRARGPDRSARWRADRVLLGCERLIMRDARHGDQPMHSDDGMLTLVFNGEIANTRALRERLAGLGHRFRGDGDTEVVLAALSAWGVEAVARLNGMFALALWDSRRETLTLARDRFGIKPLYYRLEDRGVAFASSASTLARWRGETPAADPTALSRYLVLGYHSGEQSAFAGVRRFPPAHVATVDAGAVLAPRPYWRLEVGGGAAPPRRVLLRRLEQLCDDAVERALQSDLPLGVLLSGGLDSALVAVAARRRGVRLPACTLSFAERSHDEAVAATAIAASLGLPHTVVKLAPERLPAHLADMVAGFDEPLADATPLPLLALARACRPQVKGVLTGWGGDELFGGYPTLRAHRFAAMVRVLPRRVREVLLSLLSAWAARLPASDAYLSLRFKLERFLRGMRVRPEVQHLLWMGACDVGTAVTVMAPSLRAQLADGALDDVGEALEALREPRLLDRILHLDMTTFLPGNGLFQVDRATMAASLEARVPLLDHDLVDAVLPLPASVKLQNGRLKSLIHDLVRESVPPWIVRLPKKGFGPPTAAWLRGPLRGLVEEVLSSARVQEQRLFDPLMVSRLIGGHLSGQADRAREVWAVLHATLWHEHHVLRSRVPGVP